MLSEVASLSLSYAAGALSTLSPCVLPILPIVLFGAIEQHVWGPAALAAGLSLSFSGIAIFVALIGLGIGVDAAFLRLTVAILMVGIGVVLLIPSLQHRLALAAAPVATGGQRWIDKLKPGGIRGQFLLGIMLGAIWSPCSGPTLGAAVGLAAQSNTAGQAAALTTLFGLGAATPILLLAYGSRKAIEARRTWLSQSARIGRPLMASALILIGGFVLTGFDKIVEASLTRAMPDWLVTVTTRL